jgi:hypothetical protein
MLLNGANSTAGFEFDTSLAQKQIVSGALYDPFGLA